jgi:hypothetical protein
MLPPRRITYVSPPHSRHGTRHYHFFTTFSSPLRHAEHTVSSTSTT